MKAERKHLNDEERTMLWRHGVKCPRKCGVQDLLAMLPSRWKERGEWVYMELWRDSLGWNCNSPYTEVQGACGTVACGKARGDTMLECLLNAVLRLAVHERDLLSRGCLANTGLYEDDLYRVSSRCAENHLDKHINE